MLFFNHLLFLICFQVSGREVFEFRPELVDDDDAEADDTKYAKEDDDDDDDEVVQEVRTLSCSCVALALMMPNKILHFCATLLENRLCIQLSNVCFN